MKHYLANTKLVDIDELPHLGKSTVATNGCFDILHPGHVYFLEEASALGRILVVGLNSDASVRQLKGPERPIFSARHRAYVLAGLQCVTFVCIFNTKRATSFLKALRPDIWVKGGDYTLDTVDRSERAAVLDGGGQIKFIPPLPGFSTTRIIKLM
jgi:rfaE bifunctional protein nucleotidyltransferase chain/domain